MEKVSENPLKNRNAADTGLGTGRSALMAVTAVFVTLYLTSNIMAVKVISIFGLFYFDAGTLTFPFAYMLGDVLTEIWGYRIARKVIWLTLLCNILLVLFTMVGVWLPSPEYLSETADAYGHIFTYVPRIVLASLAGFLVPFVLIAFAGTVPARDLLLMIAFQYVSKLAIEAFFGTPMAYAVIGWIRRMK